MGKEPCTVDIDAEDLRNIFKELREDNDRYIHYQEILDYIECDTKLSMLKTDALLIKAVEKRFGESNTVADIVLMDLGLLEGYNYNVETTITNRREKFLRESDFLIHDDIPYTNAPKNQQKSYQRRLESLENNFLLRLAKFLYRPTNRNNLLSNIEDYIDDGVAILPTPSYIKRKPLRDRIKKAVIKYFLSGRQILTLEKDIVINKNNEYEIKVDLTKDANAILSMIVACIILCISLPIYTTFYIQKDTLSKSQELNIEYQTRDDTGRKYQTKDDITGVLERAGQKLEARPYTLDSSSENGNTVSPF